MNFTVDENHMGLDGRKAEASDLLHRRPGVRGDSYTVTNEGPSEGGEEILALIGRPGRPNEALRRALSRKR